MKSPETILDEKELVRRLLAKEPEAERVFFETHRARLYKACVYILGYRDSEAEDVVQEAFVVAYRQLGTFEFRSSLFSWLYRICINLCYEHIRKRKRMVFHAQEELEILSGSLSVDHLRREQEEAEKKKMLELMRAQKELMGDPCQGLLDLRDGENNSYAQISETLRIPIGTVMSRLARCKETLKQLVLRALGEVARG